MATIPKTPRPRTRTFFTDSVVRPDGNELDALDRLRAALESGDWKDLQGIPFPPSALLATQIAVEYLSRNLAVAIEPYDLFLTTQRVADLLKVSRPTVIEMLDRKELSYEKTAGGHRRVSLASVLDYRRRRREGWRDVQPAGETPAG